MDQTEFAAAVKEAATRVVTSRGLDPSDAFDTVVVERPKNPGHGDYTTTVAFQIAGREKIGARAVASLIADAMSDNPAIASVEVAGPGFINATLSTGARGRLVARVLAGGDSFGRCNIYAGEKVNLECSSRRTPLALSTLAAPAGPLWETL